MVDFLHHIPDDLAKEVLITASKLSKKYIINFEPVLEQNNPLGKIIIDNDRGDFIRSDKNLENLYKDSNCKILNSMELKLGPLKSRAILACPEK